MYMINIKYLTSGFLYTMKTPTSNPNPNYNYTKKIDYYRLSDGFKDANNKYLSTIVKNN
jgi:hypothetical protein